MSVMGIFNKYANPDLIPLEKEAWGEAVKEKHELIFKLQEGLDSMDAGTGRPAEEVFKELRAKYNFRKT